MVSIADDVANVKPGSCFVHIFGSSPRRKHVVGCVVYFAFHGRWLSDDNSSFDSPSEEAVPLDTTNH